MFKNDHFFFYVALLGIVLGVIFFSWQTAIYSPSFHPEVLKGEMRFDNRTPCPPHNPHCQPDPTATKKPANPTATKQRINPTATKESSDSATPVSVNRAATKTALALAQSGAISATQITVNPTVSDQSGATATQSLLTPTPIIHTAEVTVVISITPAAPLPIKPTIVPFVVVIVVVLGAIYLFACLARR